MCVCGEGGREGGVGRPPFLKLKGPVMIDSTALFRPTPKDFAQALNAFVPLLQDNHILDQTNNCKNI